MPCNGRFPILIAIAALLAGSASGAALLMTGLLVLCFFATFFCSWILSHTILRTERSHVTLELPPYRLPRVGQVIVRSVFDRTLYVLGRAVIAAAPAGLLIWLLANITVGGGSLLSHISGVLDPIGRFFGLDGVIFTAFLLAFPANEIVLPLILMGYTSAAALGGGSMAEILQAGGWSELTYVNMLLLTLFHMPCATTLLSIKKETGSLGYTLAAAVIPPVIGLALCALSRFLFLLL